MIAVLHLIDDPNVGGVTRGVADLTRRMGPGFAAEVQTMATAWRIAPRLVADVVVVDFTLSWAKLLFLLSLRLRCRGRLIIVEHSYTEAYERERVRARSRFRVLLRLCFRVADRVVAVSDGQAAWLQQAGLAQAPHLLSIPQAIGTEAVQALPAARRHAGPLRLGAYGRYTAQKGFDLLIAAMHMVPPYVASLDLAGYGEDEAVLRRAAADLPHVRVHGPCDGPAGFLAGIDCVVVPSRWEAFGLVGLEARAAGRPVIAAAVDGLVEQMSPAWGELVPPNDPAALAAAIHQMAARDLAPMAAAARRSTENQLDRKVAAWRGLLLDLTDRCPRRPVHLGELRISREAAIAECEPAWVAECESPRCGVVN